ncbi:MAG: response regulator [Spirochaetaceae bacterium]|jgi:putative two-component system response regulator|nr:response regulator [Spirochaetaceae bacterium]
MDENKSLVLVVDDVELNLEILKEILKDDYNIITASCGSEALDILKNSEKLPKILLLDVFMPGMTGYEMFDIMKKDDALRKIPVIFITTTDSETEALSSGAVDFISKPFKPDIVRLRVKNQVTLKNYSDNLEEMVVEKTAENTYILDNTMQALADIIEYRNLESGNHVKRTQHFIKALIDEILEIHAPYADILEQMEPDIIVKAMALHDVGKIGIPDKILLKPARLTPEEFEIMKTHTTIGKKIIEEMMASQKNTNSVYLRHCRDIAWCHHERPDGKGYPQGLLGDAIPLSARLASVADVYDALVCPRVYKSAFPHEKALEMMNEGRGTQFDSCILDAMMKAQDKFIEIFRKYA